MDNAYVDGGEMLADQYRATGQLAKAIDVLKKLGAANPADTSVAPLLQQYEGAAATSATVPAKP